MVITESSRRIFVIFCNEDGETNEGSGIIRMKKCTRTEIRTNREAARDPPTATKCCDEDGKTNQGSEILRMKKFLGTEIIVVVTKQHYKTVSC